MTGRKMTRLEGMLLGALVEMLPPMPTEDYPCNHWTTPPGPDGCPLCSRIIAAHALVERTLKRQRKKDKPRRAGGRRRRPAGGTVASGRGGTRVGERRSADRQVHIIDKEASPRDVALAKNDLVGFFADVLDKHHGGGY
jgi:hypothetical protein